MKILNKILFMALFVSFFTSCSDYLDVNDNPNNPTSVPSSTLLPSIEGNLSYAIGGDVSRYAGIMAQSIDGVSRQFVTIQNYSFVPGDVDNLWANLYSGVLSDIDGIKIQAEANGNNHYLGVAQIMEAYTMLMITDLFGDAPYSEFNQGGNIQPAYDSQADIYNAIFELLSSGHALVTGTDDSGLVPGNSDLIYGGDMAKWAMFAKSIEARAYLRQENFSGALASANAGYASMGDQATFTYGSSATTSAPWYQYIDQRGDIEVGDSYVALMDGFSDPRVDVLGAELALPHPVYIQNRDLPYLSYTELQFIKAEAAFRTSGAAAAKPYYLAGIKSSFDTYGVDGYADYVAQSSVSNVSLENIMLQKYIALGTDPETFTDWRRTGIPSLTPNSGNQIPRRFPYPQSELNFNPNNVPSVTLFDRVAWDN